MHVLAPHQFTLILSKPQHSRKGHSNDFLLISLVLLQWVEGHSTSLHEFIRHLICYSLCFSKSSSVRCDVKIVPATMFEKSES